MPEQILRRYKLGLLLLGILTLGLAIMVAAQGAAVKQDKATSTKAASIASKLNDYVYAQQQVPSSLAAADIKNVPASVSYHKNNDTSYRFCVTYNADSNDFSALNTAESTVSGLTGIGGTTAASGTTLELSIPSSHHKGPNCQTITPALLDTSGSSDGSGADSGTITCSFDGGDLTSPAYQNYLNCLNQ